MPECAEGLRRSGKALKPLDAVLALGNWTLRPNVSLPLRRAGGVAYRPYAVDVSVPASPAPTHWANAYIIADGAAVSD